MEAKRDNPLYKYKPTSFYNHGPILPNVQEISKRYKTCFYKKWSNDHHQN